MSENNNNNNNIPWVFEPSFSLTKTVVMKK